MDDLGKLFAAELARPLVVSDIDNVLAWHAEAVCNALNARFGTSYLVARMTAYPLAALTGPEQDRWLASYMTRGPWIANLAPDHAAISALAAVRAAGSPVVVSSDRPAQVAEATAAWLDYWRVPRDSTVLNGPGSKSTALAGCGPDRPGVLIDDDPRKWLTVARAGVEVWTPSRPWTPAGWQRYPNVRVFTTWDQVLGWLGVSSDR